MKGNKLNISKKKNESFSLRKAVAYFKKYALNCRYSFNRMLNA